MKLIAENYLLMTRQSDFTNKLLRYFYQRLGIFLSLDVTNPPFVVFTSNIKKVAEYYNDPNTESYGRAFYDEDTNTVVFNASKYNKKSELFKFNKSMGDVEEYINGYLYMVPLSDIYHELIHGIQYQFGIYEYTNMIEATDECLTYFVTGEFNHIDYVKSTLALWYVARYELGISKTSFYTFIRNCIVRKDYPNMYFLTNKNFIRLLAKHYNGDFKKFMNSFTVDFYDADYMYQFQSELNYIHNLIFYKY